MRIVVILLIVFSILFFSIQTYWSFSRVKIQILTWWKGNVFAELYKDNTWFDAIESYKVLSYSAENATVYYISEDGESGDVLEFSNNHGRWICRNWTTVWSKHGSADGFVWPYLLDRWLK